MNENEMTHSEFYGNMTKEEAELRLALAMTKVSHHTGNDFSIRRQVIDPAQLNQCDVPDPRIVKTASMAALWNTMADPPAVRINDVFFPPKGGYRRDELVVAADSKRRGRVYTGLSKAMSDFAKKSFSKDVVQADGSQNYLKLRNKRR